MQDAAALPLYCPLRVLNRAGKRNLTECHVAANTARESARRARRDLRFPGGCLECSGKQNLKEIT